MSEKITKKKLRKTKLFLTIIATVSILCLMSCVSTKNDTGYKFPPIEEEKRVEDKNGNITVYNKSGKIVFYYDSETDSVTIPFSYWLKIYFYGIETGGLDLN